MFTTSKDISNSHEPFTCCGPRDTLHSRTFGLALWGIRMPFFSNMIVYCLKYQIQRANILTQRSTGQLWVWSCHWWGFLHKWKPHFCGDQPSRATSQVHHHFPLTQDCSLVNCRTLTLNNKEEHMREALKTYRTWIKLTSDDRRWAKAVNSIWTGTDGWHASLSI